jgi:hypothetical protein
MNDIESLEITELNETEWVDIFQALDDHHIIVSWDRDAQAWYFYNSDEIVDTIEQTKDMIALTHDYNEPIMGDGGLYESSESAAYAAASFYGLL